MSSNTNTVSSPKRQPAKRVLAPELQDATETFTESDNERAPNFTILPTGERANRVFIVGTLVDTENVGNDSDFFRGKVRGPTGTFYVYAGRYQPEGLAALRSIDAPEFISVIGKIQQYEPDDGGQYVSITPESITVVDKETRNRWIGETTSRTRERIHAYDAQESDDSRRALDAYGDDLSDYESAVQEAIDELSMSTDANTDSDTSSD